MALSNNDKDVLEEIIVANGDCINSKRCQRCPFRARCLPEFLNPETPSQEQRLKMAQDVIAHHFLVDEDSEIKDHEWDSE